MPDMPLHPFNLQLHNCIETFVVAISAERHVLDVVFIVVLEISGRAG
jgi:hypothetical protein